MIFSAIRRFYRGVWGVPPHTPGAGAPLRGTPEPESDTRHNERCRFLLASRPAMRKTISQRTRIRFLRMFSQARVAAVARRRFALRLELMTIVIEPLQIVKRIVIAWNNVIAVRAMPVAQRRMHRRLTTIVRALADDGAQSCPPAMGHGQTVPAVAGVPAHMHLHSMTPCR